ncbi:hypothetical protein T4B_3781 [Trichinella pseudospiralis]|uniref:Uncharacterized protein n=1 Tax=Trichinella pseudospiralis TaxID=6337 RepID=A0A0V1H081_TRIPS|nr:hypothetical protein T4B_3781 [Trichinella pseudospiralis]
MAILASRTLGKSGRSGYERIKSGVEVVCALVKKDLVKRDVDRLLETGLKNWAFSYYLYGGRRTEAEFSNSSIPIDLTRTRKNCSEYGHPDSEHADKSRKDQVRQDTAAVNTMPVLNFASAVQKAYNSAQ